MLLLRPPCSGQADDIRNYQGMRLSRDDKPEGMDDNLQVDFGRVIQERMSEMCVREFGVSSLSILYTYA